MICLPILLITFLNKSKFILLHTVKWFQVLLSVSNNSIQLQLNDQKVLFLTIQFSISYLLALSFNVKQVYLIHRQDPIRCYLSGPEWTWERWQWSGTLHFPKLLHYWSLTIRLFCVISRTFVWWGGANLSTEMQSVYSTAPADLAGWKKEICRFEMKSLLDEIRARK